MTAWQQLTNSLVDLCLHRTLRGFEQALGPIWKQLGVEAWAVFLPPSFQAGDRQLFVGQGVRPPGPLMTQATRQGIESLTQGGGLTPRLLVAIAGELAPTADAHRRVLQVGDAASTPLIVFVFRRRETPAFSQQDLEGLAWVAAYVRKAFLVLAESQEQEFMVGLFRLISNLHPEGICVLDRQQRPVFENRNFREHLMLWEHGSGALLNLNLPRSTALPAVWQKACQDAFRTLGDLKLPATGGRMVVSQGPVVNLAKPISDDEEVAGMVRYLVLRSSIGLRPYLLLTSSLAKTARGGLTMEQVAERFELSRREVQMAELILKGHSADEIGSRLRIALPTVKTHIRNILRKAGVRTRLQFIGLLRGT
jgi:DNA-binding CsgD family transcriptional regulator/PAS domain-containing protein